MSGAKYWIWLATRKNLNKVAALGLVEAFGSPAEVYFAAASQYADAVKLKPRDIEALRDKDMDEPERIMSRCDEENITIITYQDSAYPERLRNIYDPPLVLYVKGRLPDIDSLPAVAIVGKRKCTPYGMVTGERLGREITEHGGLVVSGMAEGIDTAGHKGALRAGGQTVAVLGTGVDYIYPASNRLLYEDIIAAGAVVSEEPPGTGVTRGCFPRRNRIISGLSAAVLVVEADMKSGSLITANIALEQGREVFAVPGNVDAETSAGCIRLIREGAGIVENGWDVMKELAPVFGDKIKRRIKKSAPPIETPPEAAQWQQPAQRVIDTGGMAENEKKIVETLLEGALHVDEIIARTQLSAGEVLGSLTFLEVSGTVRQLDGKRFELT